MFDQEIGTDQGNDTDRTTDDCGTQPSYSPRRALILTATFLVMIPGSLVLFAYFGDKRYGTQFAAIVGYTAAVILYTFSSNRGNNQPYLFECPYVQSQFRRLALRHIGYLVTVFFLVTAALQLRPYLPPSWVIAETGSRSIPPFLFGLAIFVGGLAITQILTNRTLLYRAHFEDVAK